MMAINKTVEPDFEFDREEVIVCMAASAFSSDERNRASIRAANDKPSFNMSRARFVAMNLP